MLAQLLERQGQTARSIQIASKPDMPAEVEANRDLSAFQRCFRSPDHVWTPYLELQAQQPKLNIAACLWRFERDAEKIAIRLNPATGHRLFTTLPQVLKFIAWQPEKCGTGGLSPHQIRIHLPGHDFTLFNL